MGAGPELVGAGPVPASDSPVLTGNLFGGQPVLSHRGCGPLLDPSCLESVSYVASLAGGWGVMVKHHAIDERTGQ